MAQEKINYRRKVVKRQTVWNFMRRNPIFRASEIMMICDLSYSYFQSYIRALEKAGYVKFIGKKRNPFSSREYRFVKNTGVVAPLVAQNILYDYNNKDEFSFSSKTRKIEIPQTLMSVLDFIIDGDLSESTRTEIIENTNISEAAFVKWWKRLQKTGVVGNKIEEKKQHPTKYYFTKYKKRDGVYVYEVNTQRAKIVKEAIEKGAYTHYKRDLRELWLEQ